MNATQNSYQKYIQEIYELLSLSKNSPNFYLEPVGNLEKVLSYTANICFEKDFKM